MAERLKKKWREKVASLNNKKQQQEFPFKVAKLDEPEEKIKTHRYYRSLPFLCLVQPQIANDMHR